MKTNKEVTIQLAATGDIAETDIEQATSSAKLAFSKMGIPWFRIRKVASESLYRGEIRRMSVTFVPATRFSRGSIKTGSPHEAPDLLDAFAEHQ